MLLPTMIMIMIIIIIDDDDNDVGGGGRKLKSLLNIKLSNRILTSGICSIFR